MAADAVPLADDAPGKDAEAGQLVKTTTQTVMHTDFEEPESPLPPAATGYFQGTMLNALLFFFLESNSTGHMSEMI